MASGRTAPAGVDPFKPYLDQQWGQGRTNAWTLFEEIQQMGYPGGYAMVRDYLRPKRPIAQPPGPRPPRAREVVSWILTPPDTLDEQDRLGLKQAREDCAELDTLSEYVRSFARMLTRGEGADPPQRLKAVREVNLPPQGFANGLERDLEAVKAGLTLPWSSGVVEGHVNRIKILKRQMYGGAGFDLLRKRVLLA